MARTAKLERNTKETQIKLSLNIDGRGEYSVSTTVPFLDHMLCLFAKHGLFDLTIEATGDTQIDFHHTVEDVGIVLGDAFKQAVGDKKGIRRYGWTRLPMDESLADVALDLCDRSRLVYNVALPKSKVGEFDAELAEDFFKAFADRAGVTLHIHVPYGDNLHHILEGVFKAFAKALDQATSIDERVTGVPSTKGML